ncbi:MAG: hydratase [Firmicutes bacterium]|nr:hydratase [Bacillota bacterium]
MPGIDTLNKPAVIKNGRPVMCSSHELAGREKTIAYRILRAHQKNVSEGKMKIAFDSMISHDITYVGVIQTARASGMKEFPIPYALTNCHNSLCAVGGTINEDDHTFGLSAAMKYGGIYVPPNQAVIHQFAREKMAKCGGMILGSDSHTRYGCYGCMGVGEGGGELAKQLLGNTWDIEEPEVVLVWVTGKVPHGVGPHDIAIDLVAQTFPDGFVKNRILEFAGPGIEALSMDFRIGVDVMTTETSCLSSIWETDGKVKDYYENVGRPEDYKELRISEGAYYDRVVMIDLSSAECMIAMPFHPSKAYTIRQLQRDPMKILKEVQDDCDKILGGKAALDLVSSSVKNGKVCCDQGVIVGCSGGMYEDICTAADILEGGSVGNGYFDLSVYPSSAPINLALLRNGISAKLAEAGAVMKPCFCGPCFGAGDTPANNTLSIRHATRNFPNREGSRPSDGQMAAVALMDARSIAATALRGGVITAASEIPYEEKEHPYSYDGSIYDKRCYFGFGNPKPETQLRLGPNITDWPKMPKMKDDLLVRFCAVIDDPVTTTDELIPSGETSSYRSNPVKLSDFALSRRVPGYVQASKDVREIAASAVLPEEVTAILQTGGSSADKVSIGSCIVSKRPGDGSAREQAASCQKVLGGFANLCYDYATKRYRSNCINWGIVPFTMDQGEPFDFSEGDWLFVEGVREGILAGKEEYEGKIFSKGKERNIRLYCRDLSSEERLILTEGCLMNYYAAGYGK